MALMFPRIAHNFAKAGYYPTDEVTLERCLSAVAPCDGTICILDPCAGEGSAIAEVAHCLGRDQVRAYAVEYDRERAQHARKMVDFCLYSDLMDTLISRQSFGLLWLNPPYGDLAKGELQGYEFRGRPRLEKLFYQRSLPLLQYRGVLIYIIPSYVLDSELVGWLSRHFTNVQIYRAADDTFRQVVIFGIRTRQRDLATADSRAAHEHLLAASENDSLIPELPADWLGLPYMIPANRSGPEHFYRVSVEPEQFAQEVHRLGGLWHSIDSHFRATQQTMRPPARALSKWHLSLALAAGCISGVVRSASGRRLVVRGATHKEKVTHSEFTTQADGSVRETRILTDKFVPVIRAWEMTPGTAGFGQIVTIR